MIGYNNEENKTSVKTSKEDGFNKNVGVKGSHISGGQKQRVAIARVVIRKPNLLLLDEATSALDSINEKKVQESLDRMMENKTCINIAHRIDTIKNSNVILVFEKGEIVEKGTYDELMELRGYFYKL
jgi:ATP-binding cassette subfamily B (MDR/TAP) protein 1